MIDRTFSIAALSLVSLLCVSAFAHLQSGTIELSFAQVWRHLLEDDGSTAAFIMQEIRLPRLICAVLAGAALAVSGLLIQVITRNPLGDPGLTGVSGGAAFGVAVAVTLISPTAWIVLGCGLLGGIIAATLTFSLSAGAGTKSIQLILAGIAVSLFFVAATGALMIAERSSLQSLYIWMIGGFSGKGWVEVFTIAPLAIPALLIGGLFAPILSVLALDDTVGQSVGAQMGRWRLAIAALAVVMAAGAVCVAGPIAFVGFISAHLVRVSFRYTNARLTSFGLLVLTGLVGALLTVCADLLAQLPMLDGKVPAGIWLTVLGGAVFLGLARQLMGERALC